MCVSTNSAYFRFKMRQRTIYYSVEMVISSTIPGDGGEKFGKRNSVNYLVEERPRIDVSFSPFDITSSLSASSFLVLFSPV